MRERILHLVALAAISACFAPMVHACSSAVLPPIAVDRTWTAFSGVVTDYSVSTAPVLGHDKVTGIVVRVTAAVLSTSADQLITIYVFGDDAACRPIPRTFEDVSEQYPRGSEVTIIAARPEVTTEGSRTSIVANADDWGSLARVPDVAPRTSDGLLDFSALAKLYETHPAGSFSMAVAWRNTHRTAFEDYEYLRALLALDKSSSDSARTSILENLQSYKRWTMVSATWSHERYRKLVQSTRLPRKTQKALIKAFAHPKM